MGALGEWLGVLGGRRVTSRVLVPGVLLPALRVLGALGVLAQSRQHPNFSAIRLAAANFARSVLKAKRTNEIACFQA
jgi:hypothetical protein